MSRWLLRATSRGVGSFLNSLQQWGSRGLSGRQVLGEAAAQQRWQRQQWQRGSSGAPGKRLMSSAF